MPENKQPFSNGVTGLLLLLLDSLLENQHLHFALADLIFQEEYYEGLEGGILEAFAKLFPDNTRLYIYPYKSSNQDELVTVKNFKPSKNLQHLYTHLLENGYLVGLKNVDESLLGINPAEILADIQKGRGNWENNIPEPIVEMIINNNLLGFANSK